MIYSLPTIASCFMFSSTKIGGLRASMFALLFPGRVGATPMRRALDIDKESHEVTRTMEFSTTHNQTGRAPASGFVTGLLASTRGPFDPG